MTRDRWPARTTSAAASAPTAAATAASAPAASLATDIAATRLAIAEACVQRRLSAWLAGAGLFELRRRREQKEARGAGERCVFVSSICRDHLAVETRNRNGRTSLAIRRSAATSGHCKIRRGDTELVLQDSSPETTTRRRAELRYLHYRLDPRGNKCAPIDGRVTAARLS